MKIPTALLASMAIVVPSSASRFYECGKRGVITFGGIQSVCNTLGSNWCSTDCNLLYEDCGACQYKPAGEPPAADVAKLQGWCSTQKYDTEKAGSGPTSNSAYLDWYTYDNFKGHCN